MNSYSQRRERLRNLIIISLLAALLIVLSWETVSLGGSREGGAQVSAATDALVKANARAVTAYAFYELAGHNDPSGSRALLLAREAVGYYLKNGLPLDPKADSALRQAVEAAPPWRMTLPRHYHASSVTSATLSPDGRFIVTAGADGTARVWRLMQGTSPAEDAGMGHQILLLEGHTSQVNSAVFSPDGGTILTASDDGTARVWLFQEGASSAKDGQTGYQIQSLEGHTDKVNSAVFSPDGRFILTASDDGTARVWDAGTGQQLRSLDGHAGAVTSAAYSPDTRRLSSPPATIPRPASGMPGRASICVLCRVILGGSPGLPLAPIVAPSSPPATIAPPGYGMLRRVSNCGPWRGTTIV